MVFNLHMKQYKNDTAHLQAHKWFLYSHRRRKTINKQKKTQNLNSKNSFKIPTLKSESQLSFYEKFNLVLTKITTWNQTMSLISNFKPFKIEDRFNSNSKTSMKTFSSSSTRFPKVNSDSDKFHILESKTTSSYLANTSLNPKP
jgi:hypothetical protein